MQYGGEINFPKWVVGFLDKLEINKLSQLSWGWAELSKFYPLNVQNQQPTSILTMFMGLDSIVELVVPYWKCYC